MDSLKASRTATDVGDEANLHEADRSFSAASAEGQQGLLLED
ncbi:hypothetical protein ACP70R_010212 [Stipagrostis hirtigluma subsp. patula]